MIRGLSLLFVVSCGEKDISDSVLQTSTGGTFDTSEPNVSNDDQNEDQNNDTDDQTSDGPEGSITEESPVIENLNSFFNIDSEGIEVLETHVIFTDPQNDVENGQMFFEYSSESTSGSLGMEIGGAYVILESGDDGYELTHYLYDIDVEVVYEISVQLQDLAGNVSDIATSNVNPVGDEE
jgi:hypothetical protein